MGRSTGVLWGPEDQGGSWEWPGGPREVLAGPGGAWKRSFSFLLEGNSSTTQRDTDVFSLGRFVKRSVVIGLWILFVVLRSLCFCETVM